MICVYNMQYTHNSYNYFGDRTNINYEAIKKKFASIKPEKTGDIIWSYIFLLFKTRLT